MTVNTWVRGWDIRSHTDPNKTYRVSLALGGHYGCSCGAWRFAKANADGRRPDCKHIDEVKANIGMLTKIKGVDKIDPRIVRAELKTAAFVITELSAEQLIKTSARKVRVRDEF